MTALKAASIPPKRLSHLASQDFPVEAARQFQPDKYLLRSLVARQTLARPRLDDFRFGAASGSQHGHSDDFLSPFRMRCANDGAISNRAAANENALGLGWKDVEAPADDSAVFTASAETPAVIVLETGIACAPPSVDAGSPELFKIFVTGPNTLAAPAPPV